MPEKQDLRGNEEKRKERPTSTLRGHLSSEHSATYLLRPPCGGMQAWQQGGVVWGVDTEGRSLGLSSGPKATLSWGDRVLGVKLMGTRTHGAGGFIGQLGKQAEASL